MASRRLARPAVIRFAALAAARGWRRASQRAWTDGAHHGSAWRLQQLGVAGGPAPMAMARPPMG